MALLNLLDVSLSFGGPAVLENINFQVEPGERICLLGRNGAGKSTLMKVIMGDMKPDTGHVYRPANALYARLTQDPSITQALHVINGDTLNKKLSDPNGYIALFQRIGLSEPRVLDQLSLAAYGRYPAAEEKQTILGALAKARVAGVTQEAAKDSKRQALEDMVWAMLTSKEFLFNH